MKLHFYENFADNDRGSSSNINTAIHNFTAVVLFLLLSIIIILPPVFCSFVHSFICSMMIFCNYIPYFIKFILQVFTFCVCSIPPPFAFFSAKIVLLPLLYHYRVRALTTCLNTHTHAYMCISDGDSETGENSSLRSFASALGSFAAAAAAAECDFMAPAFYHCLIHLCHLSNYYFHHLLLLVLLLCLCCYCYCYCCRGNYFATLLTTTIHYSVRALHTLPLNPLLFGAAVIHTHLYWLICLQRKAGN